MKLKSFWPMACLLLCCLSADAQLDEHFDDGDFSSNPAWSGITADFIVNAAKQLQSNNTTANSQFYLSAPNSLALVADWEFYVRLAFNPSSVNYTDVFLTASAGDLSAVSTTGYFVRIGNTNDEICLYRKNATGALIMLIDGVNGLLNNSNNELKIRVTRDAANKWTLYRDLTGTGNHYSVEGAVTDNTYISSAFFGILVKQSTVASFAQRHYFDDIVVKPFVPDLSPPVIVSATATSITSVDLLFNEPLSAISSQQVQNYVVDNGIGYPQTALLDNFNSSLVHLGFNTPFPNGTNCRLTVNGVEDISGNAVSNASVPFSFYTAAAYDIVIDEIMADPSPTVGLPGYEWIELRNASHFPVNLRNWKLNDESQSSGPLPDFTLQPDSCVLLCSSTALSSMAVYGKAFAISSFPSLNDDGELLWITNEAGNRIHAVRYATGWYGKESKKNGGWSLEMIDVHNPCSGISNWKASEDIRGGTPGRINSVDAPNADISAPQLLRAYAIDSLHIMLVFDEPLDSAASVLPTNYTLSHGINTPVAVSLVAPVPDRAILTLGQSIEYGIIYEVTVTGVRDCAGNIISSNAVSKVGLSAMAAPYDVVVNEILFNPPFDGTDYVELYNRSKTIIDLKQLKIANRNSAGLISSISDLTAESRLFFPGDYLLVTGNVDWVKSAYHTVNPSSFLELPSMPSYNDDKGNVILLNLQGEIIDEISYSEKWHFSLISNREGVSLERISADDSTMVAARQERNWHSASTSSGYGTPGYRNSQVAAVEEVKGSIQVYPKTISPDNDGQDDFGTIGYEFPSAGYVASITIFDAAGRPVRYLQRNALCGTKGFFRWDGLGENGQQLRTGLYILFAEVFNLEGRKKQFRLPVVVVRRG